MKTITVNVTASELIRQAMEEYRRSHLCSSGSLRDMQPVSVGNVLRPLTHENDILEEMLDENWS